MIYFFNTTSNTALPHPHKTALVRTPTPETDPPNYADARASRRL